MLQVKKKAIYFILLTNAISTLYAHTCNIFYYNLTNLRYFNTCICRNDIKKGADFTADTPHTLKYYEKTTYFFNRKYNFIICHPITIATTPNNHQKERICQRCHQFNCAGTATSLNSILLM